MTRVLLTGASGFIAAHVLDYLLAHGHSVVATVRSTEKADKIRQEHSKYGPNRLDFAIVPDIAQRGAFEQAVVSTPPIEAVIHTASPFHFNYENPRTEMLDPAINGTVGILEAVQKHAPSVKRVVITSSFASMIDLSKKPGHVYTEADWNPQTEQDAINDKSSGYRVSKVLAERAAWKYVEDHKPGFDLVVLNPPLVLGPVAPWLNSLDSINTSNERVRNLINGSEKEKISPTGTFFYIDVRDLALTHVLAIEKPAAGGQRYFVTNGGFSNAEIAEIISQHFPAYRDRLPTGNALDPGRALPPDQRMGWDNSRLRQVFGIELRSLDTSIVDVVKSLQEIPGVV